jgi:hypothetical protein
VVEVPRARALVKSAHIMPLKIRFRPKKICTIISRESIWNMLMKRKYIVDVEGYYDMHVIREMKREQERRTDS